MRSFGVMSAILGDGVKDPVPWLRRHGCARQCHQLFTMSLMAMAPSPFAAISWDGKCGYKDCSAIDDEGTHDKSGHLKRPRAGSWVKRTHACRFQKVATVCSRCSGGSGIKSSPPSSSFLARRSRFPVLVALTPRTLTSTTTGKVQLNWIEQRPISFYRCVAVLQCTRPVLVCYYIHDIDIIK